MILVQGFNMSENNERRIEDEEGNECTSDQWNAGELLCLVSSVLRSGDKNWVSVSRSIKPFGDPKQPSDWYTPKKCALQYSMLLRRVEDLKKKSLPRTERETSEELLVKHLTYDRLQELNSSIEQSHSRGCVLKPLIEKVAQGEVDDDLELVLTEIEEQDKYYKDKYDDWLSKRELLNNVKRSNKHTSPLPKGKSPTSRIEEHKTRTSLYSEQNEQDNESLISQPCKDTVELEEGTLHSGKTSNYMCEAEISASAKLGGLCTQISTSSQHPTPSTSPLLTSLLQSSASQSSLNCSAVLHSTLHTIKSAEVEESCKSSNYVCDNELHNTSKIAASSQISIVPPQVVAPADSPQVSPAASLHHQTPSGSPQVSAASFQHPTPSTSPLLTSLLKSPTTVAPTSPISPAQLTSQLKEGGSSASQVCHRPISSPQPFFNPTSALATAAARQLAVATASLPHSHSLFRHPESADICGQTGSTAVNSSPVSSVTLSAPTLSKLLEMPPSVPGKLPPLPTIFYNSECISIMPVPQRLTFDEVIPVNSTIPELPMKPLAKPSAVVRSYRSFSTQTCDHNGPSMQNDSQKINISVMPDTLSPLKINPTSLVETEMSYSEIKFFEVTKNLTAGELSTVSSQTCHQNSLSEENVCEIPDPSKSPEAFDHIFCFKKIHPVHSKRTRKKNSANLSEKNICLEMIEEKHVTNKYPFEEGNRNLGMVTSDNSTTMETELQQCQDLPANEVSSKAVLENLPNAEETQSEYLMNNIEKNMQKTVLDKECFTEENVVVESNFKRKIATNIRYKELTASDRECSAKDQVPSNSKSTVFDDLSSESALYSTENVSEPSKIGTGCLPLFTNMPKEKTNKQCADKLPLVNMTTCTEGKKHSRFDHSPDKLLCNKVIPKFEVGDLAIKNNNQCGKISLQCSVSENKAQCEGTQIVNRHDEDNSNERKENQSSQEVTSESIALVTENELEKEIASRPCSTPDEFKTHDSSEKKQALNKKRKRNYPNDIGIHSENGNETCDFVELSAESVKNSEAENVLPQLKSCTTKTIHSKVTSGSDRNDDKTATDCTANSIQTCGFANEQSPSKESNENECKGLGCSPSKFSCEKFTARYPVLRKGRSVGSGVAKDVFSDIEELTASSQDSEKDDAISIHVSEHVKVANKIDMKKEERLASEEETEICSFIDSIKRQNLLEGQESEDKASCEFSQNSSPCRNSPLCTNRPGRKGRKGRGRFKKRVNSYESVSCSHCTSKDELKTRKGTKKEPKEILCQNPDEQSASQTVNFSNFMEGKLSIKENIEQEEIDKECEESDSSATKLSSCKDIFAKCFSQEKERKYTGIMSKEINSDVEDSALSNQDSEKEDGSSILNADVHEHMDVNDSTFTEAVDSTEYKEPSSEPLSSETSSMNSSQQHSDDKQVDEMDNSYTASESSRDASQVKIKDEKEATTTYGKQWYLLPGSSLQSSDPSSQSVITLSTSDSSDDSDNSEDSDESEDHNDNTNENMDFCGKQPKVKRKDRDSQHKYKTWKKSISIVWREASYHKYANVFSQKVTDDVAPGYHSIVNRPMDLSLIKRNIDNGTIKTTQEFQRDMMLMFQNAIMYNSSDHDVYHMAVEMQRDVNKQIQDYLATQLIIQDKNKESLSSSLRAIRNIKALPRTPQRTTVPKCNDE